MAHSASVLKLSVIPTGNKPILCSDLSALPFSREVKEKNVMRRHAVVEIVTERMRPFITEGASRERVAEGRVRGLA